MLVSRPRLWRPMKAVLIPLDGGNSIEIHKSVCLVGRQINCDLLLDHKTVSRLHCVLVRTKDQIWIRDLGSTNGCRVNGQRVERAALLAHDVLSIGIFKYRIHIEGGSTPAEPKRSRSNESHHTEIIDDEVRSARPSLSPKSNSSERSKAASSSEERRTKYSSPPRPKFPKHGPRLHGGNFSDFPLPPE